MAIEWSNHSDLCKYHKTHMRRYQQLLNVLDKQVTIATDNKQLAFVRCSNVYEDRGKTLYGVHYTYCFPRKGNFIVYELTHYYTPDTIKDRANWSYSTLKSTWLSKGL